MTARVIIDTDPGIDDAHAILLALRAEQILVEGFTTVYGNATVQHCTRNLLHYLDLAGGAHLPVYQGSAAPLVRNLWDPAGAQRVHGPQGAGGLIDLPIARQPTPGNAIQWLINTVMAHPGDIEILALGPLTNIALAILVEPAWAANVKRLIFMGGAIEGPGNVRPRSSSNMFNDAEAAKIVFHAPFQEGIVMVGQDVTRDARLTAAHRQQLRATGRPDCAFLDMITEFYHTFYASRDASVASLGVPIHDLLVPAFLLWPELFHTDKLYVTVETEGDITRGQTIADYRSFSPHEPQMTVCLDVPDYAELFGRYLQTVC